jgi:hypothetical protein
MPFGSHAYSLEVVTSKLDGSGAEKCVRCAPFFAAISVAASVSMISSV